MVFISNGNVVAALAARSSLRRGENLTLPAACLSGEEQARAAITGLTGLFQTGRLRAVTKVPLAEVVRAHQLLEDRAVPGRLLLVP
jgi:hypothetical protein